MGMTKEENVQKLSFQTLKTVDEEMYDLCKKEAQRQQESVELIASESYLTEAVLHVSASLTHNKYSEGYPGARYYGGTDVVDKIESLCQKKSTRAFRSRSRDLGCKRSILFRI